MTPEQREMKRAKDRVANMSPERLAKKRARDRVENMTAERLERKRAAGRAAHRQRVMDQRHARNMRVGERIMALAAENGIDHG